ncbi:hypothetical protein QAD02_014831 [Eretmocerus hayati]|uniref:Uncharacterized protein n=1 Tax=Eretmocerus hayati TaxID=131215 RepID=A0ACC2P629_9HYME|nr:hypothetical protein QAD02_014831 [Eretmocerus hayati]
MQHTWRYFNWPADPGVYADDFTVLPDPGDLHGAVAPALRAGESARAPVMKSPDTTVSSRRSRKRPCEIETPRPLQEANGSDTASLDQENPSDLAKSKNLEAAASREDEDMHHVRFRGVQTSRGRNDRMHPIKGPDGSNTNSEYVQPVSETNAVYVQKMVRISECYPSSSRPRRWLAGAPGGWWPSDLESDSSDGEGSVGYMRSLPFKKRRIIIDEDSAEESAYDAATQREPQSCQPRQGRPGPRMALSILPHGSSKYDDLERSFGSLSTTAIASSDDATEDDERPASSTSSSAYGSASDEGATAASAAPGVRGPSHVSPAAATQEGKEGATPTTRHQRRSRRERAARNARWRESVPPQPIGDDVIDLTATCSEDDECSKVKVCSSSISVSRSEVVVVNPDNFADQPVVDVIVLTSDSESDDEMKRPKFEVPVYRALCAAFENTRHPFDGVALIKYVQAEVTRKRESIRVANYRDKKEVQEQQEGLLDDDTAGPSAQPEPPRQPKRKREKKEKPHKKKTTKKHRAEPQPAENHTAPTEEAPTSDRPAGLSPTHEGRADALPAIEHHHEIASPEQQMLDAPPSHREMSAPVLQFGEDLARAWTSTPFAHADVAGESAWSWTLTPAAIVHSEPVDLGLSAFLESLPPLPSPMAISQPPTAAQHHVRLPPLDLVDLDDAINDSLRVPPTPATPEHLRGAEPLNDALTQLQVKMPPLAADETQPPIRMRIVRRPIDKGSPSSQLTERSK